MVPSSGSTVSWPPSSEPMPNGEPGSCGPAISVLLRPLRLVTPIGKIGGRYTMSKPSAFARSRPDSAVFSVPCTILPSASKYALRNAGRTGTMRRSSTSDAPRGSAADSTRSGRRAADWFHAGLRLRRWSLRQDARSRRATCRQRSSRLRAASSCHRRSAGIACASPTFQQLRAGFQRVLHIVADLDLDLRVVQPGSVRIFPAFDHDVPFAELLLDVGIASSHGFRSLWSPILTIASQRSRPGWCRSWGSGPSRCRACCARTRWHGLGAAFDEHLRGDLECLAKLHASRVQAVFGGRSDAKNVYAAELFRAGAVDDRCWSFADGSLRCGFRLGSALGGWFFSCRLCG